jgi:hypothetical protein
MKHNVLSVRCEQKIYSIPPTVKFYARRIRTITIKIQQIFVEMSLDPARVSTATCKVLQTLTTTQLL